MFIPNFLLPPTRPMPGLFVKKSSVDRYTTGSRLIRDLLLCTLVFVFACHAYADSFDTITFSDGAAAPGQAGQHSGRVGHLP